MDASADKSVPLVLFASLPTRRERERGTLNLKVCSANNSCVVWTLYMNVYRLQMANLFYHHYYYCSIENFFMHVSKWIVCLNSHPHLNTLNASL